MPAADALAGFLRALGVPGQDIPAEEDERAARYRSLLAGRRMLVVLDNAGDRWSRSGRCCPAPGLRGGGDQPRRAGRAGGPGRRRARLDLDLLPPADAVGLLRALIGARVDADPGAAAALAAQCCRLPLALRVAAELAAARPAVPLAEPGRRAGRSAAAAGPARRRRGPAHRGAGGVLLVLPAPGRPTPPARSGCWACTPAPTSTATPPPRSPARPPSEAGRVLDVLARAHLIQPAGAGPVRHA